MIRLILLASVAFFAVILLQKTIYRIKPKIPSSSKNEEKIHKCDTCGLHVPESTALNYQQRYFCSESHKLAFIETHSKDSF